MNSTFLPLVFAELYRALAAEKRYSDALDDHLADIGLGADWLGEAADAYSRWWDKVRVEVTPSNLSEYALPAQHSHFATWVLTRLNTIGDCAELSTILQTSVMDRTYEEIEEFSAPAPTILSPTIIGWTLGTVIGGAGGAELAVPVIQPADDNVRAAYAGLLEHVLLLQAMSEPWPEMMQTAMYWRGYGLAEALRPDAGSGGPALKILRTESVRSLGGELNRNLSRHLDGFGKRRNALSHIADDESRPRFVDVVTQEQTSPSLEFTVRAMTQFVFQEVASETRETRPAVVRRGAWENLERDIHVWE